MSVEADSQDFVQDAKDRQALNDALDIKEKELTAARSRNYDLTKEIEALREQVAKLQEQKIRRQKPKFRAKGKQKKNIQSPAIIDEEGAGSQNKVAEQDPEQFYAVIAARFPQLYISSVVEAEKKFAEADLNGDGTIDCQELEAILDKSGCLFTSVQVKEILSSIDIDHNESIDLLECLEVLYRLQGNRTTKVPQHLAQRGSSMCSLQ
ncbi:uncharacterized protein LOC134180079 [Corticium candelabrum]|uniref:uncharacterized protein LOC134180079 n=1 Tax=Corticium candelabrum TaxID=121492 RepID=UPI002E2744D6|nr:uncharacterized protein LOC134180079 [Corticium candelabrum]